MRDPGHTEPLKPAPETLLQEDFALPADAQKTPKNFSPKP